MNAVTKAHTPGPWEWIGRDLEAPSKTVLELTVFCGHWCQGGMVNAKISDADRALIAAAPELLDAAEEALGVLNGAEHALPAYVVAKLERAIAKATGEHQ